MFLGVLGVANLWEAVVADTGAMLLAVLNSLRVLKK
jgi:Cd2+/Zn2+-exporting ATPase